MAGHKHAEAMRLYAEDAATNIKPWELWQCLTFGEWWDLTTHPDWSGNEYRRKPNSLECWVNITHGGRVEAHFTEKCAVADAYPTYQRIAVHMREVTE